MSKYYRLYLYTTSLQEVNTIYEFSIKAFIKYALGTLKGIGIKHYFTKILYRDDCYYAKEGVWLKNVQLIGERPDKVVFIDVFKAFLEYCS